MYFLDVGQGDSILIVTPKETGVGGRWTESNQRHRALAGIMSPTGRSLDMLVMTHINGDHSRGLLEVLDRYDVATVVVGDNPWDEQSSQGWQARLDRKHIDPVEVSAGQVLEVESGVTLEVLNPAAVPFVGTGADRNNNAVVLRLVYGSVSFLLASDIEAFTENYLVRTSFVLESTVLKAAHHGSRSSTISAFLGRVNPAVAVIAAGSDNQFGHTHPEVANRLEEALGLKGIFRTDRQGTVELITDGTDLWVSTEKDYP